MIISTNKKLVVGLEVGTTKVVTLVGEISIDSKIKIIGVGICKSKGIDKGRINNLDSVVSCIQKSIYQAETMANCNITSVYLSLSSKYINCQNEIGIVPISEDEVTKEDIENVIHTAKSVKILNEHHILHVIPQEYSIDQQSGIKNPIGLSGTRMQVRVHLITCHQNIAKNIIKAVETCNIKVDQVIFSGLASSKSVLSKEECKLGVCMIDIGGGTIDFTTYIDGFIQDSQVIPYAGNIVTKDISYAFNTSYSDSEIIKINYESALKTNIESSSNIELSEKHQNLFQNIQFGAVSEVIESRYNELLTLINNRIIYIQKKLYKEGRRNQLSSGIVLTGGASSISLIKKCAEKIFRNKIRIAKPINISGLTENINEPHYSTVVGLLHYGKEFYLQSQNLKKKVLLLKNGLNKLIIGLKKNFKSILHISKIQDIQWN